MKKEINRIHFTTILFAQDMKMENHIFQVLIYMELISRKIG